MVRVRVGVRAHQEIGSVDEKIEDDVLPLSLHLFLSHTHIYFYSFFSLTLCVEKTL